MTEEQQGHTTAVATTDIYLATGPYTHKRLRDILLLIIDAGDTSQLWKWLEHHKEEFVFKVNIGRFLKVLLRHQQKDMIQTAFEFLKRDNWINTNHHHVNWSTILRSITKFKNVEYTNFIHGLLHTCVGIEVDIAMLTESIESSISYNDYNMIEYLLCCCKVAEKEFVPSDLYKLVKREVVETGNVVLVRLFHAFGVFSKKKQKLECLTTAVSSGFLFMVRWMLVAFFSDEKKIDIVYNRFQFTRILEKAIIHGHVQIAEDLYQLIMVHTKMTKTNDFEKIELYDLMIEYCCDFASSIKNPETHVAMLQWLHSKCVEHNVKIDTEEAALALEYAARHGHMNAVMYLVSTFRRLIFHNNHHDITDDDDRFMCSCGFRDAMKFAAQYNHLSIVQYIVEEYTIEYKKRASRISIVLDDVMTCAVSHGNFKIGEFLLRTGHCSDMRGLLKNIQIIIPEFVDTLFQTLYLSTRRVCLQLFSLLQKHKEHVKAIKLALFLQKHREQHMITTTTNNQQHPTNTDDDDLKQMSISDDRSQSHALDGGAVSEMFEKHQLTKQKTDHLIENQMSASQERDADTDRKKTIKYIRQKSKLVRFALMVFGKIIKPSVHSALLAQRHFIVKTTYSFCK